MFCCNCGKTLSLEDKQCPHCGNPVGESRFEGTTYTSAQAHVTPSTPGGQAAAKYTRTSYTSMPEARQQAGEVDSRTTYRPVFEGASAPEEVRQDMREQFAPLEPEQPQDAPQLPEEELSEEAQSTLEAVDEELQMDSVDTSSLRSRPIESTGRAGISADVTDYIQKLEDRQTRKEIRRAARHRKAIDDGEDAYTAPADETAVYDDTKSEVDPDQSEVFEDIGEEEFDDMRYGRAIGVMDILKVALIMVLAAALIVGGVLWFRHIRDNAAAAPIEGVTEALYTGGIEELKSHAEDAHVNELLNVYRSDGALALTQRLASDTAALDALMPAEPKSNDSLFLSVLQSIQTNIGNAVLMDGVEADQGALTDQGSDTRWGIVNSSIAQLEAAASAQDLTAILNGEQITVATAPTPTPEPENQYETLSKGMKSDAVLEMQNRLYELGYLLEDCDGAFGIKTQTAVKAFQQDAGLPVTGIADAETLTLLYSEDAPRTSFAQSTPTPAPTPTEAPVPEADADLEDAEEVPAE